MILIRGMPLLLALLLASSTAWAHKPLLSVEDNEDGTIYIEVGFSDGSSGAGNKIFIKEKATGKVIAEYKVAATGSIDVPMPKVPYIVVFDAGEGHQVEMDGPFSKNAAVETDVSVKAKGSAPDMPVIKSPSPVVTVPSSEFSQLSSVASKMPVAVSPQVIAQNSGATMAMQMMMTTNLVIAVLLAVLLAGGAFWMGYSIGRQGQRH